MNVKHVSTGVPRSVSRCSQRAGGVNAVCHSYTGGVVKVGSDVMGQPKVVPIYWGNTVNGNSALKLAFDQFFSELLYSNYCDRLTQYGVQQPLVMPSHAIAGSATSVSYSDVGSQLSTWFANGTVPPPPVTDALNYYYVILAPPGATIGQAGECGYHNNTVLTLGIGPAPVYVDLAWGLVYFPKPAAGATPVSIVNSVCYCLVHEMVEAFTNPRGQGWSVNVPASGGNAGQNCEIGDLCETKTQHAVGRWNVETYWSNQDKGCVGNFASDWTSLGAPPTGVLGAPVVGHNADGRLEFFVVSNDGNLWHRWQTAPSGSWSSWETLAANNPGLASTLRVGNNADGRMEVYGMQEGSLWHVWQTAPSNGWSSGGSLGAPDGGLIGVISVRNNHDGRLEIFGVGTDRQLHHIWQTSPNNGWSGWQTLGGLPPGASAGDPRVVNNADGRLEVFLFGNDQNIWHIWQTSPNNGWSGWASLGKPPVQITNGAPFVGNNADGRIEVFVTGNDGGIYHIWQTSPSNGWGSWAQLQSALPGVQLDGLGAVTNNADGRFQVFFIGSDGALWTMAQSSPSNGWLSVHFLDAAPIATSMNAVQIPGTGRNANGTLTALVRGSDGNIWQITQIWPGEPWGQLVTD
ncbi:MAG: hypothetical protein LAP13_08010 [Acidobacteriia bacterium]|nr:hypothetical protein [Terriglobia bacterium]